ANAFFVASEYALVSVRPTRLDQLIAQGSRVARLVRRAREDPSRFLATTQLGVTVASLLLGWVGEETFAGLILVPLEAFLPSPWRSSPCCTSRSANRCQNCWRCSAQRRPSCSRSGRSSSPPHCFAP